MRFEKKLKRRYDATLPIHHVENQRASSHDVPPRRRGLRAAIAISSILVAFAALTPAIYFAKIGSGGQRQSSIASGAQLQSSVAPPPLSEDYSGIYSFEGELCHNQTLSLEGSSISLSKDFEASASNTGAIHVIITQTDYQLSFIGSYLSSCTFIESENSYVFSFEGHSYRLYFEFGQSQTNNVIHLHIRGMWDESELIRAWFYHPL